MAKNTSLDEIIDQLDPEAIPAEYIILAKIVVTDGKELTLTGEELEEYLKHYSDSVMSIKLMLDIKQIKDDIENLTDEVLYYARA